MSRLLPVLCLLLAACSSGPEFRYAVPEVEPGSLIAVSATAIEVRDVTLPTYAADERIHIQQEGGAIVASDELLWSDDPAREMTLTLTRMLALVTSRPVANEPWPFERFPDAQVEVRVSDMLALNNGTFRLAGQYFVGAPEGTLREHAHTFDLRIPFDPEGGIAAIAQARAIAVRDLARKIAEEAL